MSRRYALVAVRLLAVAAVVASCGDSTGPEESAAGFWDLWSLNGQAPPVSVDIRTIHTGSLDLRGNGSYAFALSGVALGEPWGETARKDGSWFLCDRRPARHGEHVIRSGGRARHRSARIIPISLPPQTLSCAALAAAPASGPAPMRHTSSPSKTRQTSQVTSAGAIDEYMTYPRKTRTAAAMPIGTRRFIRPAPSSLYGTGVARQKSIPPGW